MEALLTGFKFSFIVVLFIPGFIFIQIVEKHLLREKKPQFEKSLEIILTSIFLWAIIGIIPFGGFPWANEKQNLYFLILNVLNSKDVSFGAAYAFNKNFIIDFFKYFTAICIWSFTIANFWGYLRKNWRIDTLITLITGRNWYPNVSFQFYKENIDSAIEFSIDGHRYLGILHNAPDTIEDNFITIRDIHQFSTLTKKNKKISKFEKLQSVSRMVIKISEIKDIKAHDGSILDLPAPEKKWKLFLKILKFNIEWRWCKNERKKK